MDGQFDKAKGRAKEAGGKLTGDRSMEKEGKADRAAGAVKETAEKAKDAVGDVVDKVRNKAK